MGNAGLGTTTPISSLVQNYNSHQPLSLVFSWLLMEEVSAGSLIPSLRVAAGLSARAARPGWGSCCTASVPSSELGGRYLLVSRVVLWGDWDLRSGPDFS